MHLIDEPTWRERFLRSSEAVTGSERNALAAAAASGRLVRLAPGVYLDPQKAPEGADSRHRDRVRARRLISPDLVASHASAAALWRLPRVGAWPDVVHVVAERATGGRSTPGVRQHRTGRRWEPDVIDGVDVAPLPHAVVGLAVDDRIENAVVAADHALAGVRIGDTTIRTDADALGDAAPSSGRGAAIARFVVSFADARSGSPGESLSRLTMARVGVPAPELQYRLDDGEGAMFGDFAWPERRVIGEFDGIGKYVRDEYTGGRPPAEIVVAEKRREDRIRALGWRVVRWGWTESRSVPALRSRLSRALSG